MKQNLLFSCGESDIIPNESMASDFQLEKIFSGICPDLIKRRQFIDILTSILKNKEDIEYRAKILRDFIGNPNLFQGLKEHFIRFDKIKNEQQNSRKKIFSISRNSDSDSEFSSSGEIIKISAYACRNILETLKTIGELLVIYRVQSSGLKNMLQRINTMTNGNDFNSLVNICVSFENFDDNADESELGFDTFEVFIKLNEASRIEEYSLDTMEKEKIISPPQNTIMKLFAPKAKMIPEQVGLTLADPFNKLKNALLGGAFSKISDLFQSVSKSVLNEFDGILNQLNFYECSIEYEKKLKKIGLPVIFPDINEEGIIQIKELYDPLLSFSDSGNNVVPNDVDIDDSGCGILIRGSNNSGKTVFLRSVGTAHLFAYAGLPIPAEKANIPIREEIYTLYASAEKGFEAGNEDGRFEQEVREVAKMLEQIKPNSLVMMNEIFQTTAYDEGTDGLFHILNYMTAKNIKWILVTHLHKLFDLFGDRVTALKTSENNNEKYKMVRI